MSGAAIRVEGLGKVYRIGGAVERYKTLRDTVSQAVAGIGQKVKGLFSGENGSGKKYETIWALKDVSFEVQPGEVIGIIGRNGAGKSTLLKILSRITEPTEGRVEIRGRVGSLLEVGTGFHPELTGRENVYLNGAILGMKRAEVDKKFDEIVAFAEVEKFIDTPVKHYSSGMYVRLAFSVAAHLDTDILLVDEVLSVGDAGFQRKCIRKMGQTSDSGKTVLFVSHNMTAVRSLCEAAVLLENSRVLTAGDTNTVIQRYLQSSDAGNFERDLAIQRFHRGPVQKEGPYLMEAWLEVDEAGPILTVDDAARAVFVISIGCSTKPVGIGWYLLSREEHIVFNSFSGFVYPTAREMKFECAIPAGFLNDEVYTVRCQVIDENWRVIDDVRSIGIIRVHDSSRPLGYMGKWGGLVRPTLRWNVSANR